MEVVRINEIARETGTTGQETSEAQAVVRPLAAPVEVIQTGERNQLLRYFGEGVTILTNAVKEHVPFSISNLGKLTLLLFLVIRKRKLPPTWWKRLLIILTIGGHTWKTQIWFWLVGRFYAMCYRWQLEKDREQEARDIVDGPPSYVSEAYLAPQAYLELAQDLDYIPRLVAPEPEGGVVDETVLVSANVTVPHSIEAEPIVVSNNYVIKKGKKGFYCHTLLCLLKSRFGKMEYSALNEKIIRRNADKETSNHGLRPKDKQFAVEFVVRMYWKASVFDAELDRVSSAYVDLSQSWVRRMFRRFKRTLTNPGSRGPIGE